MGIYCNGHACTINRECYSILCNNGTCTENPAMSLKAGFIFVLVAIPTMIVLSIIVCCIYIVKPRTNKKKKEYEIPSSIDSVVIDENSI